MKRRKIIEACVTESLTDVLFCRRRIFKWVVLVMILAGLVAVCPAQRRSRGAPLKIIQLPQPKLTGSISFEQALVKLKTIRQLTNQPIQFEQIGQLAWAGQGVIEAASRVVPRPQSLAAPVQDIYPVRLYFATSNGVHIYEPDTHRLQQVFEQDVRGALAPAVARRDIVAAAGCNIILVSQVREPSGRSAVQSRKLMLLQAGQVAQSIRLQAASLDMVCVLFGDFDERIVTRACNLPRGLEPLYVISVGFAGDAISSGMFSGQQPVSLPEVQSKAASKKAAFIVAAEDFDDKELFETLRVLGASSVQSVIASTRTGVIKGALGGVAEAAIQVSQLRLDDYDAVIFIGGEGARGYFNNPVALSIARDAVMAKKVLAAISTAPSILANAGVLRGGVRATCRVSERSLLQRSGAVFTDTAVQRHGLIITAADSSVVVQFAEAIIEALASR
jgi:protease I